MKTKVIVAIVGLALLAGVVDADPISNLVQRLNAQGAPVWMDGMQPGINLPDSAHPTQVVAVAIQAWAMANGHLVQTNAIQSVRFSLSETTLVKEWMATVVDLPKERKILLFGPMGTHAWWTRFFDIEPETNAEHRPAAYGR